MRYEIRHAIVEYGADRILDDINFEIHDKEKIAIVGRNGCGKTTLLKLIAGDLHMANLDSDETCGIFMAGRQEIGFLRQISFTDGDITVEEEIKKVFSNIFTCEARMKEIEEALHHTQDAKLLSEYDFLQKKMEAMEGYHWRRNMEIMFQQFGFPLEDLQRPIGSFSGGQQTKIAFIKLLLSKPDIMLLDEPTYAQDEKSTKFILSLLAKRIEEGLTVIIATHDLMLAKTISNQIFLVDDHKIKPLSEEEMDDYMKGDEAYEVTEPCL